MRRTDILKRIKLNSDSENKIVKFQCDQKHLDILKRLQEKTGLSASETIRRALECVDRIMEGNKDE